MQYYAIGIDIYINLCYNVSIERVGARALTGAIAVVGFRRAWAHARGILTI